MIVRILLVVFGVFLVFTSVLAQDCENTPSAQIDLTGNAVSARITTGGDLWFDGDNGKYLVAEGDSLPTAASPSAAFAGGLWLFGSDPGGGLKGAAQQYGRGSGNFDYGVGPLDENGLQLVGCTPWDRFWTINRQTVNLFLDNFDPDDPNPSVIPLNMLGWPGNGNPHFESVWEFALPTNGDSYAPFYDENLDGIYDPFDGDYPAFCGDQAVWCIFNDGVLHRESGIPVQAQVEVQLLAYSFNAANDDPLQRTTFYDYKIVNRAQEDLIDLYAGLWIDFDLGCFTDDLIGSIPEDNLVYVHNVNALDNQNCDAGITSFQTEGVVQIAQVVNASVAEGPLLSSAAYTPVGGLSLYPPPMNEPREALEYYNYLQGFWADGTPMTRGGVGFNQEGVTTQYAFDGGATADGSPWLHCTTQLPLADRRMMTSTGPYTLQPSEMARFTLAMTTVLGVAYDGTCPDTDPIVAAARTVKAAYDEGCTLATLTSTDNHTVAALTAVVVYPNPTRQRVTFHMGNNRTIRTVEILDALGRPLLQRSGNDNKMEINLRANGLEAGVYFYRLTDAAGGVASGQLVVR